jgi:hypothetical protein
LALVPIQDVASGLACTDMIESDYPKAIRKMVDFFLISQRGV